MLHCGESQLEQISFMLLGDKIEKYYWSSLNWQKLSLVSYIDYFKVTSTSEDIKTFSKVSRTYLKFTDNIFIFTMFICSEL